MEGQYIALYHDRGKFRLGWILKGLISLVWIFNLGLFGEELVELFMFEVEFTSKIWPFLPPWI